MARSGAEVQPKREVYLDKVHLIHGFNPDYAEYHPMTPRSFGVETAARRISKMCTGTQPAQSRRLPDSPGGITLVQCRLLKASRHAGAKQYWSWMPIPNPGSWRRSC